MKGRKPAVNPLNIVETVFKFKERVVTEVDGKKSK